jgi:hypothetical protein
MSAMRSPLLPAVVAVVLLAGFRFDLSAQSSIKPTGFQNPDSLVTALYRAVTFVPGTTPDWGYVRSMFYTDAVIVLRVTRDSTAIMSVDGFVQDFVDFIARAKADRSGFQERVLKMKPLVFGNVADVLVLYEARLPGSPRGPQKGVDSFHLARKEGRWRIVSIVNDVVTPDRIVPKELEE